MSFDLANPFRKQAPPPPSPRGPAPKEWARIYLMAVVLMMVVGTMVMMKKMVDNLNNRDKSRAKGQPGGVTYRLETPPQEAKAVGGSQEAQKESGKKAVAIPPLPEGAVNYKELASPFKDGRERIEKETPEFINLLNVFMNKVTPEDFSKAVNPNLSADLAFLKPAESRGEVIRSYGSLIQVYTERLDTTTPNNVEVVYLGVMTEFRSNRTVYFYMPELPKDPATGKPVAFKGHAKKPTQFLDDWVEVEGVFLRQYLYPSQYDDERGQTIEAKAAVLFVKNLRIAPKPNYADPRGAFVFIIGGLAVVIAGIVVVAGVMSRKYGSGSLRMKMFQLKKGKGQGAGLPPPAPEKQLLGDEIPKAPPPEGPAGPPPSAS